MNASRFLFLLISIFLLQTQNVSANNIIIEKINQIKTNIEILKNKSLEEKILIPTGLSSTTLNNIQNTQEIQNRIKTGIKEKLDDKKIQFLIPFEQAIKNLKNLSDRLKSRISKIEGQGIELSNEKQSVVEIDEKISEVEVYISDLGELLAMDITPLSFNLQDIEKRKNDLAKIKNQTEKIKKEIKNIHESIIKIINSLKEDLQDISTSTNN